MKELKCLRYGRYEDLPFEVFLVMAEIEASEMWAKERRILKEPLDKSIWVDHGLV